MKKENINHSLFINQNSENWQNHSNHTQIDTDRSVRNMNYRPRENFLLPEGGDELIKQQTE
jgi:hypothetical protein